MALVYKSAAYRHFSAASDNRGRKIFLAVLFFSEIIVLLMLTSVNITDIMYINIC